jgi:hypothetical protein
MEPWRLILEPKRFKVEPWRVFRPVVEDSHHFDEERIRILIKVKVVTGYTSDSK